MTNLLSVDWSTIPAPTDDGGARHLVGLALPSVVLPATDRRVVDLSVAKGMSVVYAYPRTAEPGSPVPDSWDMIPGARGCTPQSCSFRDHFDALKERGVQHLFGLSTQSTAEQKEAAERLGLPFPLLSDAKLEFTRSLQLPTFHYDGAELVTRLTLIAKDGKIEHVFYPVFSPDRNAADVITWLETNHC